MANDADKTPTCHQYVPYYCEENVWHLVQEQQFCQLKKFVLFISNERRACPLWWQRACCRPEDPVLWDYHTILLAHHGQWQVWDLDTQLGMPIDAHQYLQRTFLRNDTLIATFEPLFKLIDPQHFAENLSSDRSHMRTADGCWTAPPPSWAPILQGQTNLQEYIDMRNETHGEVLDFYRLIEKLASTY